MRYFILFIVSFLVIYFVYYFLIINRKNGLDKFKKGTQAEFFKRVYNLDFRKIEVKKFAKSLSLVNAFIMSITITIIELFNNLIIKMLVGFIIIVPLMLVMYKILGEFYKKEGK